MKKGFKILILLSTFIFSKSLAAQSQSDSLLLESIYKRHKNNRLRAGKFKVDRMLNAWSIQSQSKHHEVLKNDTVSFVYQAFSRFLKDFLSYPKCKMLENKDIRGNYFLFKIKLIGYL